MYAQQGVGINTVNPQQALHIGGKKGTIRLEGVNALNNPNNTGDFDGDGDLTNNTFPLYINNEGKFILDFSTLYISEEEDAIPTPTRVTLTSSTNTYEELEIFRYTITATRPTIIEVKYNISFDVKRNAGGDEVSDYLARRISNYFSVDGVRYGIASKNFTNKVTGPSLGNSGTSNTFYNVGRGYINLAAGGNYTIIFYGGVSSGNTKLDTSVNFASGVDSLLFRVY
jgi:hypothetical protein